MDLNPGADAKGEGAFSALTMDPGHDDTAPSPPPSAIEDDIEMDDQLETTMLGGSTIINVNAPGSSTLFSTPAASPLMKKNASVPKPALSSHPSASQNPPSSSAASSKRKHTVKPSTPEPPMGGVQYQQMVNVATDFQTSLREVSKSLGSDPYADDQEKACALVSAADSPFSLDEQVLLYDAFAASPRQVTSFLAASRQGPMTPLQMLLARNLIKSVKKDVAVDA